MKSFRSAPIKLSEINFTDSEGLRKDIQVLKTGVFFHEGQKIKIDKETLKSMVKNFHAGSRGVDLAVDYSHESEKEAAAWFHDIYLSEDGHELWGTVEWTIDGAEAVKSKKYRYISADFNFSYENNETLKDYGPTLFGAGLTNRPVLKKMKSVIELSEKPTKENEVELEEMKKKLAEMEDKLKGKDDKIKELTEKMSDKKLSEKENDLAEREKNLKLAEDKIEADKKLTEKKGVFDKMLSEGKTVEAQREYYMNDDFAKFAENASQINLSEKGSGSDNNGKFSKSETPAQDEVIELAEKKMNENSSLNISDATNLVFSEKPELYKKYEEETNA